MKQIEQMIHQVAPTLDCAMRGPFSGMAKKFISERLLGEKLPVGSAYDEVLQKLLDDRESLRKIKELDQESKMEMEKLDLDVCSMVLAEDKEVPARVESSNRPQLVISIVFLAAYFLMLVAIFLVEVSDTLNMQSGGNSLLSELQILFGVLTAGVGQILSYWFGGVFEGRGKS